MNGNHILTISVFSLFILTAVFFHMENPYWYVSILTFILAICIILFKAMWKTAGWLDDKLKL